MRAVDEIARLARDIGTHLLQIRDEGGAKGQWDGAQFKAVADVVAHDAWVAGLNRAFPDVPVISEEGMSSHLSGVPQQFWLVDPLDGTASYSGGFPGFVTQAALVVDGDVTLSVVFAPSFEQLYVAKRGGGAWLNNHRLMRKVPDKLEALIDNYPEPRGIAKSAFVDLKLSQYIECGSISLKILRVADGTADLFIKDVLVRDWDIAAPKLVIEETGGALLTSRGETCRLTGHAYHAGIIAAPSLAWSKRVADWYIAEGSGE